MIEIGGSKGKVLRWKNKILQEKGKFLAKSQA